MADVLGAPPCPIGLGVVSMLVGRVVTGVACGATTVVVPMYLGEISPPQLRGTLGTCFQLCVTIAMLFAQVLGLPSLMGSAELWPSYLLLVLLPAGLQLLLRAHLLESPRWLAGRSHEEAFLAQQVLAKLRGQKADDVSVLKELDFMQMGQVNKEVEIPGYNEGLFSMLRDRSTRAGLLICGMCMVVQQFSGINNAFNFSTAFLSANGIEKNTITLIAILMNVGNVGVTLLSVQLMDKAGRRALLLGSAAGMFAAIGLLTLALTADGAWTSPVAVVAVVFYVMAFGIGLGPIPWLLPAELFAMDKCAKGSGIAASSNWLANFLVVQAFPTLSNSLGGFCFLPFALVLLFFLWFAHAHVPETRGKTLEQILAEISGPQQPQRRRGLHSPYESPSLEPSWPY
jgi:SP family facilitated glucose transporter-like MFS transporter 4